MRVQSKESKSNSNDDMPWAWFKNNPDALARSRPASDLACQYRVRHDSFCTMLKDSIRPNSRFGVEKIINDWWEVAFHEPFPENGMPLEDASLRIQYKLMGDDAVTFGHELTPAFWKNHNAILEGRPSELTQKMRDCLRYLGESEVRQKIIHPISKEPEMAKVIKINGTGSEFKSSSKEQKEAAVDMIGELLLNRTLSDKAIFAAVEAKFPGAINKAKVAGVRKWLNQNWKIAGKEFSGLGKNPLVEIKDSEDHSAERSIKSTTASEPQFTKVHDGTVGGRVIRQPRLPRDK